MKNIIKLLIALSVGAVALAGCDKQGTEGTPGKPMGQQSSPSPLSQRGQDAAPSQPAPPPAAQTPSAGKDSPSTPGMEQKKEEPKN